MKPQFPIGKLTMPSPMIEHRQLVYQNQYQKIYRIVANFGDFTKEYFVSETGIRVGVVAVKDSKVLLVRQYRLLIDGLSWEIPGGSPQLSPSLRTRISLQGITP